MSNGGDWCCVNDIDALNDVYREIAELIGYDDAMILYTHLSDIISLFYNVDKAV